MTTSNLPERDSFKSKFGVFAASAGCAIGLGNIWRFPYLTGENGGGAFLIIYLIFIIAIGVPVVLSEFIIGRRAQLNAFGSFKKLAPGTPWKLVGLMGVAAAFFILVFYGTIAGWTLEYIYNSITGTFNGKSSVELESMFESFKAESFRPVMWQLIFMGLTALIVLVGVQKGIEKYSKILMPLLLVIIIVLCVRSLTLPGAKQGLDFLFKPDFSKINTSSIFKALGQAAFSLSIGMGTLITYGSYINKQSKLTNVAIQISIADTLVAIIAGIAIFPAVFAFNIEPDAGTGLVFIVLPNIFQQMAFGNVFSFLFFVLLAVAALTSSISILEVLVAYLSEEFKMKRKKATILAASTISFLGIFCTMSWGLFKGVSIFGNNLFEVIEFVGANLFLPLGALFIIIFVGWYLGKGKTKDEISNGGELKAKFINIFMFLIKFIAPVAIAIIFLNSIGLLKF